jgi:oxygen-independent coproporphyrinogen-3 oxidase
MSLDPAALDLDHLLEVLPRYTTEGPRYTSYPTAPVWTEDYGPEEYRADLGGDEVEAGDGLSLYVHVPFCENLCHYCACNKMITKDHGHAKGYLEAIEREVATVREAARVSRMTTQFHWGGGTPTWLAPDEVRRLFDAVADAFPMHENAEISIEVDPRVTTEDHIEALVECGFNRISMGVQDFDPKVQQAVHRIQPADDTTQLVALSRAAGFESVNFDLIERVDLPDATTKLQIMLMAIRRFLAEGYLFIGLDHFARPDDELSQALADRTLRRNFMGHTTQAGVDLIGFGPSAISELRRSFAQSHRSVNDWEAAVTRDGVATQRGHRLSRDDVERRWVIERIMCHGEVRAPEYEDAFGRAFGAAYADELASLAPLKADGLVALDADGSLKVTPAGRLLVRNVAMAFDAYLAEQRSSGVRMFSKTV